MNIETGFAQNQGLQLTPSDHQDMQYLNTPKLNDHPYRVRKNIRPLTKEDNPHSRTLRSTCNTAMLSCTFCNQQREIQAMRMCRCQERYYHFQCAINYVEDHHRLGTIVFQCSQCALYYPITINERVSLSNLTVRERRRYIAYFMMLLLPMLLEIVILSVISSGSTTLTLVLILIVLQLIILFHLIRKLYGLSKCLDFEFREYKQGDELLQQVYERQVINILRAKKFNRVNCRKQDDLEIK